MPVKQVSKDGRIDFYIGNKLLGYLDVQGHLFGMLRNGYAKKIGEPDHADNPASMLMLWRKKR